MLKRDHIYHHNIVADIIHEPVRKTLFGLLKKVSKKFQKSFHGLLIDNCIISVIIHKSATDLQISLTVNFKRNKSFATLLYIWILLLIKVQQGITAAAMANLMGEVYW